MSIRQQTEELERQILSPLATLSSESRGRLRPLSPCDIRTEFQRDRDRIIHSKAFRRLKHKTQVFSTYETNDHLRTRLTHTLEVSQVARTIARALRLNEDLTEAISLMHDCGHVAFSHSGERVLNEIFGRFRHNEYSAKLAQELNLTQEVIDGVLHHSGTSGKTAYTLEGQIVRYADKIAYLNSDMDDGIRMGLIREEDVPPHIRQVLGLTAKERLRTLIRDLISHPPQEGRIFYSPQVEEAFGALRSFMFQHLYKNPQVTQKDKVIRDILFAIYENECKTGKTQEEIKEFIAGMSDTFALQYFLGIYHISPTNFNML